MNLEREYLLKLFKFNIKYFARNWSRIIIIIIIFCFLGGGVKAPLVMGVHPSLTSKLVVNIGRSWSNLGSLTTYGDQIKWSRIQAILKYNILFSIYLTVIINARNFCSAICTWDPFFLVSIKLFDWFTTLLLPLRVFWFYQNCYSN